MGGDNRVARGRIGGAMAWRWRHGLLAAGLALAPIVPACCAEIGQIKIARGEVSVERRGVALAGTPGLRLQDADTVRTGADGSVGITMNDDSLLSAGPNSVLSLDHYALDASTNQGRFTTSLNRGTLAVVSGRIAKNSPEAMTVRTPRAILGVRGTEFVVRVGE